VIKVAYDPLHKKRFLSFFLYIIFSGCLAQSVPTFKDITSSSGIDFQYTYGDHSYENIMESSGAGISIIDYNQDGNYDIYFLNGTYLEGISSIDGKKYSNSTNALYKNNGNGTFTDVTKQAGIDNKRWSMAAGIYDYDHDGDEDIYLANYGPNDFYRNNGDGTFTDVTDRLGLRGPNKLNGFIKWSVSVAFFDYDQDDRTDILVGNFLAFDPDHRSSPDPNIMPHPGEYQGQATLLYRQKSDGTFEDVTKQAHLFYPDSKCMGLTVFDVDNDRDLDIFQSNDHQLNFLFINEDNAFKEVGVPNGVAVNNEGKATGSMHGTLGDINGDGLLDILVTDLRYGSLYQNIGQGVFKDVTISSGVASHFKGKGGWAALLADFDNDGDLDIFSANGTAEELILQPPLLLENNGNGHFKNSGKDWGTYFRQKHSARGAAALDFDNDGDLDLVVSHLEPGTKSSLLQNDLRSTNHWLGVSLQTAQAGTSIIGTKLTLTINDQELVRIFQPSTGYLSYSDPRIHFGLGATHNISKLKIEWPDGTVDIIKNFPSDQYISVRKGIGVVNR